MNHFGGRKMFLFNLLADASEGATNGNNIGTYIVMGVIALAIIGVFIWQSVSGKKKQKEAQDMLDGIRIGDKVKTIGGVCGYIVEINNEENTFVLETGTEESKSFVKFDKGAIYQTAHVGTETKAEVKTEVKEKPEEVAEVKAEEVQAEVKEETEKPEKPAKKSSRKK